MPLNSLILSDVCWLRLDFEQFTTAGPSLTTEVSGGVCIDSFSVTVGIGTNWIISVDYSISNGQWYADLWSYKSNRHDFDIDLDFI